MFVFIKSYRNAYLLTFIQYLSAILLFNVKQQKKMSSSDRANGLSNKRQTIRLVYS